MCKISSIIDKFMDNQPVKNRQYLKPFDITNTALETNEDSTSELGFCIVLGAFRGMVDGTYGGMDGVTKCISSCKYASKI